MSNGLDGFELKVEFIRAGASAAQEPDIMALFPLVDIDLEPAFECGKWKWACRNPRPPVVLDRAEVKLEPSWDLALGPPYIKGIEVTCGDQRSPTDNILLPLNYLHDAATEAASELVAAGQLVTGDRCRLRFSAHPITTPLPENNAQSSFEVQAIAEPLALQEGCVSSRLQRATVAGDQPENGVPVFIPRRVLEEMHRLTRAAGAKETGGVLIGYLCLDRAIPEIFLDVTEQIPAVHAQQELTSLTLTPQTWTAVDAAVRLRGQGEMLLGWWHSHPVRQWCADCPEEKRRDCHLRCDFFSAQDKAVQRCCFSRAFHVAMVVSDTRVSDTRVSDTRVSDTGVSETGVSETGALDLSTAMYGWHRGTIQPRGFHVLQEP